MVAFYGAGLDRPRLSLQGASALDQWTADKRADRELEMMLFD